MILVDFRNLGEGKELQRPEGYDLFEIVCCLELTRIRAAYLKDSRY